MAPAASPTTIKTSMYPASQGSFAGVALRCSRSSGESNAQEQIPKLFDVVRPMIAYGLREYPLCQGLLLKHATLLVPYQSEETLNGQFNM